MTDVPITPDPLYGDRIPLADAEDRPYNRVRWNVHGVVPHGGARAEAGIFAEPIPEGEQFPESEVTGEIVGISISCHGDEPDGGYVRVVGLSRHATEDCWRYVCQTWVPPWPGRGERS